MSAESTTPTIVIRDAASGDLAVVKAASTAAVAADPSLVVSISPNNSVAVIGTAASGAAVSGNPVLAAGSDGTNVRVPKVDSFGTQYHAITSPSGAAAGLTAFVTAYGTLRVSNEGPGLFQDSFDGVVIDTTNRWTTSTAGGATLAQATGQVTSTVGTTVSASTVQSSQPTISPTGVGFLVFGCVIKLEVAALLNNHRFWGWGTPGVSFAAATPLTDAYGFEVGIDGILYACIYSGGTRTFNLALTKPTDGANHRYAVVARADLIVWYQDGIEIPVASASYPSTTTFALPLRFHSINHTSGPASGPTFIFSAVGVSDSTPSAIGISDGSFPWRKSTVKPASTAAVATDPALVVAISPNNAISVTDTDVTSSASLGALSATVVIAVTGKKSLGVFKDATAMSATLAAELSFDGGVTFPTPSSFVDASSGTFSATQTVLFSITIAKQIPIFGGATHARIRVSSYTSGASTFTLTASNRTSTTINGALTAIQGTAAAATNAWPIKVSDGTSISAVKAASTAALATDPALVVAISPNNTVPISAAALPLPAGAATAANQTTLGSQTTKINDGTNTAAVKAASTNAVATDPALVVIISPNGDGQGTNATSMPVTVSSDQTAQDKVAMIAGTQEGFPIVGQSAGVGRIFRASRFGHSVASSPTLLGSDVIEGSTINSWLWTQSTTTMTIAQATGVMTLNNSATTTNATFAIITSARQYPLMDKAPLLCSFTANVVGTTNATQEIGLGAPVGTTATITNGLFFRISNTLQVTAVTSFNGTETVSAVLGTLTSTSYYLFQVFVEALSVRFLVESSTGVPLIDSTILLGLTTPAITAVSHLPAFARTYTTGTAGVAPVIRVSNHEVWTYEASSNKSYGVQLAGAGRHANINPTSFAQTAQLAAGAAPGAATPANTTSAYTTLGGEFILNATASSENLLGVFGFTVPSPYTLYVTDIMLPQYVVSTVMGAAISIHHWALMINASSANPSTATGFRMTLGSFTAVSAAAAGSVFSGSPLLFNFANAPLIIQPGKLLLVLVKVATGPASGAYRGSMMVNGYFE